jgi:predicted metal-dependent hydrolase
MATQPPKKAERMEAFVQSLGLDRAEYDPCYLGYFVCFNAQEYYEAHDVLEHLWLRGRDGNYAFYKGLIQLAGAFVHLKKQRARPEHPTDGRRLHPAVRLFRLAEKNLSAYGPLHLGLDLREVLALIDRHVAHIEASGFSRNPWNPQTAPQLHLGRLESSL